MSIENLDDSCLLRIFREINDKHTLFNCSLVNRRCHSLIFPDTEPEKRFNLGRIKVSGNLKEKYILDGFEIVVVIYEIEPEFFSQHGRKIRQLYIDVYDHDFTKYVKYLPRLERLHLSSKSYDQHHYYDGPKLERLEILEIETKDTSEPYRGLSLMDRCPSLKSAFHSVDNEFFFVDTQVKNHYLQDLVIENNFSSNVSVNWSTLKKILGKCPNLKHLAIRHYEDTDIEDENIPEMLELLPKVVLIDLRVSPGITYVSADYVEDYCKLHNRSISFYYTKEHEDDIRSDWPQLSYAYSPSCPGYSFMKHCFLKQFDSLPKIMDPIFLLPLLKEEKYPDVEPEDNDLGFGLFD